MAEPPHSGRFELADGLRIEIGGQDIRLAKERSSTGELVGEKVVESEITSSPETHSFTADIYSKSPRRASGISKEAAKPAKKRILNVY